MNKQKGYRVIELEPGAIENVYVVYTIDPDSFHVQLARSSDDLEVIGSSLMSCYENSPSENCAWELGDVCAAKHIDGFWYRGTITGLPHGKNNVEVTFVDYGNKDFIDKENLRGLQPDFLLTPKLSFRFCLEGVNPDNCTWSVEQINEFEKVVLDKQVSATIIDYEERDDLYQVQLCCEDGSIINQVYTFAASMNKNVAFPSNGVQKGSSETLSQVGPVETVQRREYKDKNVQNIELKAGEKIKIVVVFAPSPSDWWCNVAKFSGMFNSLEEEMAVTYKDMNATEDITSFRPGSVCAAFSEADGCWYRATIEKVNGPETSVFFLDYGNSDLVSATHVRTLKPRLQKLPAQAVRCSLHGVVPSSGKWSDEASNAFEQCVLNGEFTATVMGKGDGNMYFMNIIDFNGIDVATTFLSKCSEATRGTTSLSAIDLPSKIPSLTIEENSETQVYLTWINTPSDFYVHLVKNQKQHDFMMSNLNKFYASSDATMASSITVGTLVAARQLTDNVWYRGLVKKVSGSTAEVEFIDLGKCEKMPTDNLKRLDQQFCQDPALAVHCSLQGVRPLTQNSTWSGDAKDFLSSLTKGGAMCKFLDCKNGVHDVQLAASGKDVAREMVALAVVREMTPDSSRPPKFQNYQLLKAPSGRSYPAVVAFVESVDSFYVQFSDNLTELDELLDDLKDYYGSGKGKPVGNIQVGMPCVAQYDEDGAWYRAQVRSFSTKAVDIFFVDFGNTQSSPGAAIFQIEPKFVNQFAAQAIHCQLDIRESRNANVQLEKFNNFVDNEDLELVVKGKEGSKLLVDLLKKGDSLTDMLKGATVGVKSSAMKGNVERSQSAYTEGKVSPGQTVLAYVSFIESPARFWIQLAGCDDELAQMMETLTKHYASGTEPPLANPSPGQPCVALYDEDKEWYRASVMSIHGTEVKVRFVDYGNTELVDRQNIKPISAGFMSSPLLAIECCLDKYHTTSFEARAASALDALIGEQELSVTFLDEKNVSVKVGDTDIAQVMQEQGFGSKSQESFQSKTLPKQTSPKSLSQDVGSMSHNMKYNKAAPPAGSAEAIITHVENENGLFYVQLLSSESELQYLSTNLQKNYSSGGSALSGQPVKGMPCCAKFAVDGCWYRAMVEDVRGDKTKVRFVDYGNCEVVLTKSLKAITADLIESPVHGFQCKLKGLNSWTGQTAKIFNENALDRDLNVRFVTLCVPFEIQVSIKGQDLLQIMNRPSASSHIKSPDGRSKNQNSSVQKSRPSYNENKNISSRQFDNGPQNSQNKKQPALEQQIPEQVFQPQQCPTEEEAVYVSHISSDGTFFVQLVKDVDAIDALTSTVENCAKRPHPKPVVGAACGAKFSVDDQWYRGIIKSVSGSKVEVLFVDFGNGETCDVSGLKPLPTSLLTPGYAFQCQPEGLGPLTPEQQGEFMSASEDKEYLITFKKGVPFEVIIKDEEGTNLADTIFKPTVIRRPGIPKETVQAVVSHVAEHGQFYLHLEKDLESLDEFSNEVQAACDKQAVKLSSFEEGQVCCAKFSEGFLWYRASVLSVCKSEESVSVFFIDYGNTETVTKDSLLVLPPILMARPAFAYDCRISGVKRWKKSQKEKFEEMTMGKTMNARFLSTKVPYEVELTRSIGLELEEDESEMEFAESTGKSAQVSGKAAENLSVSGSADDHAETIEMCPKEELGASGDATKEPFSERKSELPAQMPPALDACVISHIDSDRTFYLQLMSEEDIRENLTETLQDENEKPDQKPATPVVSLICCAKYIEDEAWYRAVIQKIEGETVEVHFIDFGNTAWVSSEDLRELSTENLQIPPLAYKCVVEDVDLNIVDSKLEETIFSQTLTVTFIKTESVPYIVNLKLENGMDISTALTTMQQTGPAAGVDDDAGLQASEGRKCVALDNGHRFKVEICYVVSPSLFYVQLADNVPILEENADVMHEHFSSLAEGDGMIENLTVNQLCAVYVDVDVLWYRATVKSLDTDSCEVYFVDYGNTDWVSKSSVRELPAVFQKLPWQCVPCSLVGVRCEQDQWSEEVKTAFEDLAMSKSVTVDVLTGDGLDQPYAVHALNLGQSLAEMLLALDLSGVEATEVPELPGVKRFLDTTVNESMNAAAEPEEFDANKSIYEAVESGIGKVEGMQGLDKETVDDLEENEQEFSRQLKACTAQMESTMLEDALPPHGNVNSTVLDEPCAETAQEDDEDDFFEDAVEADDEKNVDGGEAADQHTAFSYVADGLAELVWLNVTICEAESASEFWCRLPSAPAVLSNADFDPEKIDASNTVETVKDVKVGNLCLVCDATQKNYRAKVLTECDDELKVTVLKLDYGTEERIPASCLYPLANHQLELPAQAFCCCLDNNDTITANREWLDSVISSGEALEKQLQVKVVGRKPNGTLLVDVREKEEVSRQLDNAASRQAEAEASQTVGGIEIAMDSLEISHSQPVLQSTVLGDTLSQSRLERTESDKDYCFQILSEGKVYDVSVAAGGRPDGFYVTLVSAKNILRALDDDIAAEIGEKVDSAVASEQFAVGSPCLVHDEAATKWVRGQVKSAGDDNVVLCIDSGKVLKVGKQCVQELPSRLLDTPMQAFFCCLTDIVPVEEQWCESALSFFSDSVSSGSLKLTSSGFSSGQGSYKVTLLDESQSAVDATASQMGVESSLNRVLVELGYAEAVAGSALDVELQVERTINDPDKIGQLETSFSEVSHMRKNSLGEDSDVEGGSEQEKDSVSAAGDAPNTYSVESDVVESDEENGTPPVTPPTAAHKDNGCDVFSADGGDTYSALAKVHDQASQTFNVTPKQESETSRGGNSLHLGHSVEADLSASSTFNLTPKRESGSSCDRHGLYLGPPADAEDSEKSVCLYKDNFDIYTCVDKEPVDDAVLTPVDETKLSPVGDAELVHVDDTELTPVGNAELTPVDETKLAPVVDDEVDDELIPINDTELAPVGDAELPPVLSIELALVGNDELTPVDNARLACVDDTELAPVDNVELAPVDDTELAPVDDTELAPVDNVELAPVDNVELAPVDNAELAPVDDTELALVDNAELAPVDDTELLDSGDLKDESVHGTETDSCIAEESKDSPVLSACPLSLQGPDVGFSKSLNSGFESHLMAQSSQTCVDEAPVGNAGLTLIGDAELISVDDTELAPSGDAELVPIDDAVLTPVDDTKLAPVGDAQLSPVDDTELTPVGDVELTPVDETELAPVGDAELGPDDDTEIAPVSDAELAPAGDAELVPVDDTQLAPVGDGELKPVGDGELTPVSDIELEHVGDAKFVPVDDTQLAPVGVAELKPADDTELAPVGDAELGPVDDTELAPVGDAELTPVDDSELEPVGDADLTPVDDSDLAPVGDADLTPVDDTDLAPVDDAVLKPVDDTELAPVGDAEVTPDDDTELVSVDDSEIVPVGHTEFTPVVTELPPVGDAELVPVDDTKLTPDADGVLTPISDPDLAPVGDAELAPVNDTEITPVGNAELAPVDTELAPVGNADLTPVDDTDLAPVGDAALTPVDDTELAPVGDAELTPVDDTELSPVGDAELTPVDDTELAPVGKADLTPVDDTELAPVGDAELTPVDDTELAPVGDAALTPVDDTELATVGDAELTPVDDTELAPIGDAELTPDDDTELVSVDDSEIVPVGDTEFTPVVTELPPVGDAELVPVDDTKLTPDADGELTPISDPDLAPVGDAELAPVNDTEIAPVGNAELTSVDDTELAPVDDADLTPVDDTDLAPVGDAALTPVNDTELAPVGDAELTLVDDKELAPVGDAVLTPVDDTELAPVGDAELTPVDDRELAPVGDAALTPVDDTELEPVGDAELTPVDDTVLAPDGDAALMPVDDTELATVGDAELTPVDDTELAPVGDAELTPVDDTELAPVGDAELTPIDDTELAPVGDAEFVPVDDTEIVPVGDAELTPVDDTELAPVGDAEVTPDDDTELVSVDDSEIVPVGDTEFTPVVTEIPPVGDSEFVPVDDTKLTPDADGELTPISDPDIAPVGDAELAPVDNAELAPVNDTEITPVGNADLTPVDDTELTPVGDADLTPVDDTDLAPVGDAALTPVDDTELAPVGDAALTPVDDTELAPVGDAELTPVDDTELSPVGDAELTPVDDTELAPVGKADLTPVDDTELAPVGDAELTPVDDTELAPVGDAALTPVDDTELAPIGDAELTPDDDTELASVDDSEIVPVGDTEFTPVVTELPPVGDAELVPVDDTKLTPDADGEFTPISDPDLAPIGDAELAPVNDTEITPVGNAELTPVDTELAPVGNADLTPVDDTDLAPVGDAALTPVDDTELAPVGDAELTPVDDTEFSPVGDAELTPVNDTELAPVGKADLTPVDDTELAPVGDAELTPVDDTELAPVGDAALTPVDDTELAPIGDAELTPDDDTELASVDDSEIVPVGDTEFTPVVTELPPVGDAELVPVDDTKLTPDADGEFTPISDPDLAPVGDAELAPVNDTEIAPVGNAELTSVDDTELAPVDDADLTPVDDTDLAPVGDAALTPVNDTELAPIGDAELTPVDDKELAPVGDAELTPVDDTELAPVGDAELTPVDDRELAPVGDAALTPVDDTELEPVGDAELTPVDDTELAPVGDAEFVPVDDTEIVPVGDAELTPVDDTELAPVGDAEVTPDDDTELVSVDDSEIVPVGDTEFTPVVTELPPVGDAEFVPVDDTKLTPDADGELTPISDPDLAPVGDAELAPVGNAELAPVNDTEITPVGNADLTPVDDTELTPVGDADLTPVDDTDLAPVGDAALTTVDDTELAPVGDAEITRVSVDDSEIVPVGDTEFTPVVTELPPVGDAELVPVDDTKITPDADGELTPVSDPDLAPVGDAELAPVNDTEIAPVGNAELTPVDDTELAAVDDDELVPVDDTEIAPVGNAEFTPVNDTELARFGDVALTPVDDTELAPVGDAELVHVDNVELTPVSNTELAPVDNVRLASVDDTELAPVDNARLAPIDDTELAAVDHAELAPVDNAELAPVDDTELLDSGDLKDESEQGTETDSCVAEESKDSPVLSACPLSLQGPDVDFSKSLNSGFESHLMAQPSKDQTAVETGAGQAEKTGAGQAETSPQVTSLCEYLFQQEHPVLILEMAHLSQMSNVSPQNLVFEKDPADCSLPSTSSGDSFVDCEGSAFQTSSLVSTKQSDYCSLSSASSDDLFVDCYKGTVFQTTPVVPTRQSDMSADPAMADPQPASMDSHRQHQCQENSFLAPVIATNAGSDFGDPDFIDSTVVRTSCGGEMANSIAYQMKQELDADAVLENTSSYSPDAQLTEEDMETMALQLESMAVCEMQKLEEEQESEECRAELVHMIEDYGNTIDVESEEMANGIADR